jgi:hypothetical protein
MPDHLLVRSSLERIHAAFSLFLERRTSLLSLSVIVRAQADGLRGVRPDVAEPLAGLADSLDAAVAQPRPHDEVRDLEKRFATWRRDTLAVLVSEASERAPGRAASLAKTRDALLADSRASVPVRPASPQTPEARQAAREALLAQARALTMPVAAPAPVSPAPASSPEEAAPPDTDQMSFEEIQALLDGLKKP